MAEMKELFSAYRKSELPSDGGYIISTFFDGNSAYTKYEITSYNNVKDIFESDEGLTFQADGQKVFVLVEPANYSKKHVEPTYRSQMEQIPYRFKELDVHTSRRQDRIMVGKEPVMTYGSFTVLKSQGANFSYIVYKADDLVEKVRSFFAKSLWQDARVPKRDAEQAADLIRVTFEQIVI
ncbi:MAG: transposase [Spirochaetaceae bacterium]